MKNVLILNDFVSKGKIAGRLMSTVLSYMDCEVFFLPTTMIANNFSLGGNAFFNIDPFIKESLENRGDLGIKFDLIFIGYIENKNQKILIKNFIKKLDYKPVIIFDPIMGDDGSLYPGLDDSKTNNYKNLIEIADIIIPNETEAKFLDLDIKKLTKYGKEIIITSATKKNKSCVLFYNKSENIISYQKQDIKVGGTGDLFDALFIGYLLKGYKKTTAIEKTCQDIIKIIIANKNDYPKANEINIEKYLTLIEG